MFTCSDCDTKFITSSCMRKHLKTVHRKDPKPMEVAKHTCPHCPEVFRTKVQWQKHIRERHGQNRKSHLICPLCSENTKNHKSLIHHLVKDHEIVIEVEQLEFDTIEVFNSWKITMERDLNVMYVKQTAGKKLCEGTVRTYYHCHRSYSCKAKGFSLRKGKAIGSNKINRACPGLLKVTEEAEKVTVIHYATHLGHTCDIGRMKLTPDERMFIAGKLSEGLSIDQILTEIRESATNTNFSRLHLLKKKDVYNLMRDLSIPVKRIKNRKKTATETDLLFNDIVTAHRGDATLKLDKIKNAHEASKDVEGCQFDPEHKGWLVPESSEGTVFVQALTAGCPEEIKCVQRCEECDICIHSYKCSCVDNKVFFNICKHIHTVHGNQVSNPLEEYLIIPDEKDKETGDVDVDDKEEIEVLFVYDQVEVIDGITEGDNKVAIYDVDVKHDKTIKSDDTEEQLMLTKKLRIKDKLELIQKLCRNVELKQTAHDEVISQLDKVICLLSQNIFRKEPVSDQDVLIM